ncbi:MAG: cache domain-containing protein, partial [Steroidobacteraceae bacterium]
MTLRLRIVLFTISILLPAIAAGAWMVAATYSRERSASNATVRETVRALSLVVERELQRRDAIVRTLAASDSLQKWDLPAFDRQARAATKGLVEGFVAVLDESQQYVNTSIDGPMPVMLRPTPFTLAQDEPALTDPFVGRTSGNLQLAYNVPVRVGGKLYNVSMPIMPTELQRVITEQNVPEGWIAAIVSKSGHIIARAPNPDRWVGQSATTDFLSRVKGEPEGFFDAVSLDGQPILNFYSTSE